MTALDGSAQVGQHVTIQMARNDGSVPQTAMAEFDTPTHAAATITVNDPAIAHLDVLYIPSPSSQGCRIDISPSA